VCSVVTHAVRAQNHRAHNGKQSAERQLKLATRKDYYAMLGVETSSSMAEIKRAYRKLAAQYHPDKAADGEKEESERMFQEVRCW
jgi:DnaJ family protein C protein 3